MPFDVFQVNEPSYHILSGFGMCYKKSISTLTFHPRYAVDHVLGYRGIATAIPAIETRYFLSLVWQITREEVTILHAFPYVLLTSSLDFRQVHF